MRSRLRKSGGPLARVTDAERTAERKRKLAAREAELCKMHELRETQSEVIEAFQRGHRVRLGRKKEQRRGSRARVELLAILLAITFAR